MSRDVGTLHGGLHDFTDAPVGYLLVLVGVGSDGQSLRDRWLFLNLTSLSVDKDETLVG